MTTISPQTNTGTGYGRAAATHDARLTEVGPGTPMGEVMRRYWHPVAVSSALTSDLPHRTKVLGEDLIVFRTKSGRPGVVFERCAHRGSSLFYGRVEDDGIRCCYHGWKFDVEGHCLEQACEPDRGRRRDAARQPWYPVEERYGLVFVYMGPPDRKPALPRYDCLEDLAEGESYHSEVPIPGAEVTGVLGDFNWLQAFENGMDPVHAAWLHYTHSGPQFGGVGTTGFPESFFDPHALPDRITWERTDHGVMYHQTFERQAVDGGVASFVWNYEVQLPNVAALPDFVEVGRGGRHDCLVFIVASDDTSHRAFFVVRSTGPERLMRIIGGITQDGKLPHELSPEDVQRFPGDLEAQRSQGPVTKHSEETLAWSDKGVVMLRRLLRQMVDDVEAGRDPMNADRGDTGPRRVRSGVTVQDVREADAVAVAETLASATVAGS